ncbi:Regulatory protein YrvL [Bacillus sp. OV194]|nr:Regulatory protein YrvL [Bacillus sp. OV194]
MQLSGPISSIKDGIFFLRYYVGLLVRCLYGEVISHFKFTKKDMLQTMNKDNNNDSFRDMNLFNKIFVVTALTFLVILSISFVLGIFFLGIAGFFSLFGVQYESLYSLLIFVLFFFLLGFIFDLFSIAFIKLSSQYVLGKYQLFFTRMVIDCTFTWLSLHTVDEFMNSITIPVTTEIGAVLLFFFIEVAFDDKEKIKGKSIT